jgi:hypothetical protein
MSAGETPGIRLACPMVVGFILLSFCLASVEIDLSVSNGVLFGMRMSSSREIFSASSFSLSMYPEYFMWISVDSHKSVKSKSGWCSNFFFQLYVVDKILQVYLRALNDFK